MSRYKVKAIKHIKSMPPLSRATLGITRMIADENYNIADLVRLIETDITLAGRCLQSINSPLYGLKSRVETINRAVVLLGARNIAAMALQTGLSTVFKMNLEGYDSDQEDLWRNGLRTAIASRKIMIELMDDKKLADTAYATGLMHDIGKVVTAEFLREKSKQFVESAYIENEGNFLAAEDALFGINHTVIGEHIAKNWHLPESFAAVMRYHHTPSEAPEEYRSLAVSVHLGDTFSMMAGTGTYLDSMDYPVDPIVDHYIKRDAAWNTITFPKLLLDIDKEYQDALQLSGESGGSDV
ncbi:MAG: HDOD domain-containing protein [Acidobacteriota bacterium]|nr:HDOD domain-containing protein [Acidobacteriota bacterium]